MLATAAAVLIVAAALFLAYRWYTSPNGKACMAALKTAVSGAPQADTVQPVPIPATVATAQPQPRAPLQQHHTAPPPQRTDGDMCVQPPATADEEADDSFTTWRKLAAMQRGGASL